MHCNDVPRKGLHLKFYLRDYYGKHEYMIDEEELLIPGFHFGDDADTCYIPVFESGFNSLTNSKGTEVSYIGNIFTANHYMVYDQSPLQ